MRVLSDGTVLMMITVCLHVQLNNTFPSMLPRQPHSSSPIILLPNFSFTVLCPCFLHPFKCNPWSDSTTCLWFTITINKNKTPTYFACKQARATEMPTYLWSSVYSQKIISRNNWKSNNISILIAEEMSIIFLHTAMQKVGIAQISGFILDSMILSGTNLEQAKRSQRCFLNHISLAKLRGMAACKTYNRRIMNKEEVHLAN